MILSRLLGTCALIAGAALLTTAFAFQDKGKEAKPAAASAAPDDAEMAETMAKWAAYATPGTEHKVLDGLVGTWTTHMSSWMEASAPPMEADGTAEVKWILGGRYLEEKHTATWMGEPFEGQGLSGFDNLKKKYVSVWCDNMGTGLTTSEGTYDARKKAITYTGQGPDMTMTRFAPYRIVSTFADANSFRMEMYATDKAGKEFRSMEITYTRKK